MSSKSYSIQKTIQNLLGTVGISKTDVSFTDAMHAEVSVHYTQLWNFEPVYKDTVVKAAPENPKPTDELLSVEDLRKFKADKLNLIKEGIMIKKPFCNRLEKLSAKELFELGNKINRLSNQHAKGLEVCPDCKGSLKVNCIRCSGIGKVLCPSCQGKEGGCSACNKTGYIECPSCKGAKKQPCTKCKGSGYVIVDTEVFCQAVCTNNVEIEFDNKNYNLDIPVVTVEPCCIQAIVSSLKFYLNESEYLDDNSFELKLTSKTQLSYLKFCLVGISKIFNFWTVGQYCVELCRPKVLDLSYSLLKNELGDAAVGTTVGNISTRCLIQLISVIRRLTCT